MIDLVYHFGPVLLVHFIIEQADHVLTRSRMLFDYQQCLDYLYHVVSRPMCKNTNNYSQARGSHAARLPAATRYCGNASNAAASTVFANTKAPVYMQKKTRLRDPGLPTATRYGRNASNVAPSIVFANHKASVYIQKKARLRDPGLPIAARYSRNASSVASSIVPVKRRSREAENPRTPRTREAERTREPENHEKPRIPRTREP